MLLLMVLLSLPTRKDTLVSFNRVIIAASDQISSLNLLMVTEVTIIAKKETKQKQQ